MIQGVQVTPLKRISNEKGDIYHALKSSEKSFSAFGEAYFSCVNQGDIKGWKMHTRMVLNLVVPVGAIKFVAFDGRKDSKTYKEFFELVISKDNYCRLTIPPYIWLSFEGVDKELNLLLNLASIVHDPNESLNCDLDDIKYNWNVTDNKYSWVM